MVRSLFACSSAFLKPSAADIIRARVRTIGVEEHHFVVEKGAEPSHTLPPALAKPLALGADAHSDVYITDVGGSRGQRASWLPYFDDGMWNFCPF